MQICDRCQENAATLRPIQQRHTKLENSYARLVEFWCDQCCADRKRFWRFAAPPIRATDIAAHIISIRQPYAWLILKGWKDCENRTWVSHFSGRVLIHASLNLDDYIETAEGLRKYTGISIPKMNEIDAGGIVGVADFWPQFTHASLRPYSQWFTGPRAWPIKSYFAFSKMTPARGYQRIYKAKPDQRIFL